LVFVEFGAFLVGDENQCDAGFVGFFHAFGGVELVEVGEFDDGFHDMIGAVDVVVVQQDFPGRQRFGRILLRGRLRFFLRLGCGRRGLGGCKGFVLIAQGTPPDTSVVARIIPT
jgi:hypothetical protein